MYMRVLIPYNVPFRQNTDMWTADVLTATLYMV